MRRSSENSWVNVRKMPGNFTVLGWGHHFCVVVHHSELVSCWHIEQVSASFKLWQLFIVFVHCIPTYLVIWLAVVVLYTRIGLSVGLLFWSFSASREVRLLFSVDEYVVGLVILWAGCAVIEASIMSVSVQGTILDTKSRSIMQPLLYIRLGESLWFTTFSCSVHNI